jgi:hypothetical protein
MHFESMESRRMLSAAGYTFSKGVLTVSGGSKADAITVVENNGSVHLELTDSAHNIFRQVDFNGVSAIKINGGAQSDRIRFTGNSIGAVIHGNGGSDDISAGDYGSGSSQVFGDNGDDGITILQGNHTNVSGGSGNDTIFLNTDNNSLTIDSATVNVDAGKGNDTIVLYDGQATVQGGGGTDTLNVQTSAGAAATTSGVEVTNTF